MRNGGIGRGWYEDDPNSIAPTMNEIELSGFFMDMLKNKLSEVFDLISQRNKERKNAAEKVKEQESVFK
jgi:hypothetical protein